MKTFRKVVFWIHLAVGLVVAIDVALLAATGLIMSFEHTIIRWVESADGSPPSPHAQRLPVEDLLLHAAAIEPQATPRRITMRAGPNEPAEVEIGQEGLLLLNAYTGEKIGTGAMNLRDVFHGTLVVHRSLAFFGSWRDWGQEITGAATIGFTLLIVSGLWLWFPRKWKWSSFKAVLLLNVRLKGKTRDWNWHNVAGFWAMLPLLAITLTGLIIGYSWANGLLYRVVGETPLPARADHAKEEHGKEGLGKREHRQNNQEGGPRVALNTAGLNDMWNDAVAVVPNWTTISMGLDGKAGGDGHDAELEKDGMEESHDAVAFALSNGDPKLPYHRTTVMFSRQTGDIVKQARFSDFTLAQRLRMLVVPIHRGEIFGIIGQAIAAFACIAAMVLAYTGIALSWRRLGRPAVKRLSA